VRSSKLLLDGPVVRVYDVCCRAPRSGCGAEEWSGVEQLVLPRRGVFVVHRRSEAVVADTNTAVFFGDDDEYRVSHPTADGDDCTVLVVAPELLREAFGGETGRQGTLRPEAQLGLWVVTRALAAGSMDALEAEEAVLALLDVLRPRRYPLTSQGPARSVRRARVGEVCELLASSPTTRWDLRALASAVHCSPFHLTRQFRALTGETVSGYLVRLRLALALARLAEGETRLAGLALDLGFAHHSHFSARFRAVFGLTPSAARETLAPRRSL
jgi:AraC-like DNA-binding protein